MRTSNRGHWRLSITLYYDYRFRQLATHVNEIYSLASYSIHFRIDKRLIYPMCFSSSEDTSNGGSSTFLKITTFGRDGLNQTTTKHS